MNFRFKIGSGTIVARVCVPMRHFGGLVVIGSHALAMPVALIAQGFPEQLADNNDTVRLSPLSPWHLDMGRRLNTKSFANTD